MRGTNITGLAVRLRGGVGGVRAVIYRSGM